MKTPWLSVVIPTIGRDSLELTLESLEAQPEREGVEVLVVADTFGGASPNLDRARACVLEHGHSWLEHDAGQHMVGQPQRTYGARVARAPWVAFTQDDNISAADALGTIELVIDRQPHPRPIFFRFVAPWRETIWRWPHLMVGNIDADCLVFPQDIAQQVEWGLRYVGDYDAAEQAFHLAGGDVYWCEEIISIARPDTEHLWWKV